MLVAGFPAGSFRTNCYVLAPAAGAGCVVVDPGQDAVAGLDALLSEHALTPAAVLLTHGHLDHTHSAAAVADAHGVPVWIHPGDRAWLTERSASGTSTGADPMAGMPEQSRAVFGDLRLPEPAEVRDLDDDASLPLAGLELRVVHTPGHTPGSVCFATTTEDGTEVVFGGDTLFQGSVGRTDLPGGSHEQLLESIAARLLSRDDATIVLPGHGPATTIGSERAHNPFLAEPTPTRGRAQ